jgi:3-oxoacyl-[acyl-carrier-protein] synthase III
MGVKSAEKAMRMAGVGPSDIDLIIYAGIVMENICPPTSVLVQDALKINHCAEYSIHSNCTCIYKAIEIGAQMLASGRYKTALLVTSQLSSAFLRAEYFNQAKVEQADVGLRWFLCDGSGAMVLTVDPDRAVTGLRVVDTYIQSVGVGLGPDMYCTVGGPRIAPLEIFDAGIHHLRQNFHNVAQLGPRLYQNAWTNMVKATGLDLSRVKHFIMNIPTKHMNDLALEIMSKDLDLKNVSLYTKLSKRGYPGPCAILQALDDFLSEVKMRPGELVVSTVTESSKWMHGGFVFEQIR